MNAAAARVTFAAIMTRNTALLIKVITTLPSCPARPANAVATLFRRVTMLVIAVAALMICVAALIIFPAEIIHCPASMIIFPALIINWPTCPGKWVKALLFPVAGIKTVVGGLMIPDACLISAVTRFAASAAQIIKVAAEITHQVTALMIQAAALVIIAARFMIIAVLLISFCAFLSVTADQGSGCNTKIILFEK